MRAGYCASASQRGTPLSRSVSAQPHAIHLLLNAAIAACLLVAQVWHGLGVVFLKLGDPLVHFVAIAAFFRSDLSR